MSVLSPKICLGITPNVPGLVAGSSFIYYSVVAPIIGGGIPKIGDMRAARLEGK
jgi:hypothetical protein